MPITIEHEGVTFTFRNPTRATYRNFVATNLAAQNDKSAQSYDDLLLAQENILKLHLVSMTPSPAVVGPPSQLLDAVFEQDPTLPEVLFMKLQKEGFLSPKAPKAIVIS